MGKSDAADLAKVEGTVCRLPALPLPPEQVAEAVANLAAAFRQKDEEMFTAWVAPASADLAASAAPLFGRTERATPEKAAQTRLVALCLAAEADAIGRQDIGGQFREIAAEVTWLERRHSGEIKANEVILLAVE